MKNNFERGFTLVELLIVITLIGILATAVLAAINPIEQMRKGRDTNSVALVSNINTALLAFYGSTEGYPFSAKPITLAKYVRYDYDANGVTNPDTLTSGVKSNTDSLAADLKAAVFNSVATSNIFVGTTAGADAVVCYIPESLAARQAATTSTKYNGFTFQLLTRTAGTVNTSDAVYGMAAVVPGTTACTWDKTASPVCALCNN